MKIGTIKKSVKNKVDEKYYNLHHTKLEVGKQLTKEQNEKIKKIINERKGK